MLLQHVRTLSYEHRTKVKSTEVQSSHWYLALGLMLINVLQLEKSTTPPPTYSVLILASSSPQLTWLRSSSAEADTCSRVHSCLIRAHSPAAPQLTFRHLGDAPPPPLHMAIVDFGRQPGCPLASARLSTRQTLAPRCGLKHLYASHVFLWVCVGGGGGGSIRLWERGHFCTETAQFSHIPEAGILSSLS